MTKIKEKTPGQFSVTELKKIPPAVILRYTLFQIPGVMAICFGTYIVYLFTAWPLWAYGAVILLWVIKDVLLLPLTWHSYETDKKRTVHSMSGKKGTVKKILNPEGIVQIGMEKWTAVADNANEIIEEGNEIIVKEQKGMKLIVFSRK